MSVGDTPITIVGNLTADPDMRYTQTGVAVAAFTVASTPRVFDRQAGEWRDGDTLFLRCSAWRSMAEHANESLRRGMRVIVTGRLRQRNYEDSEGNKRTTFEVDVEEVGPSLRYATAKVVKATRQAPHPADRHGDDPWASPAPAFHGAGVSNSGGPDGGAGDSGGFSADPPF